MRKEKGKEKAIFAKNQRFTLTDIDVAKGGESLAECLDLLRRALDLLSINLGGSLLLSVEAKVLKQDYITVGSAIDLCFDLRADAVGQKSNGLSKKFCKLFRNRLERVLGIDLAIRTAEVRSEDDGLCL